MTPNPDLADQWTEKFNALPREVREIGAAMECKTRIQHLEMEKARLLKRYRQSVMEIDDHIEGCLLSLQAMSQVGEG